MEQATGDLGSVRGALLIEMNEAVDSFRKQLHATLKNAGYERKTGIASALYDWVYTKGAHRISISGWHGTGKRGTCRYWGDGKTVFYMTDELLVLGRAVGRTNKIIDSQHSDYTGKTTADLVKLHNDNMIKALAWLRAKEL